MAEEIYDKLRKVINNGGKQKEIHEFLEEVDLKKVTIDIYQIILILDKGDHLSIDEKRSYCQLIWGHCISNYACDGVVMV